MKDEVKKALETVPGLLDRKILSEALKVPCNRCIDLGQVPLFKCCGNDRKKIGTVYYCKRLCDEDLPITIPSPIIMESKTGSKCPFIEA
jgi:hypothetical protein